MVVPHLELYKWLSPEAKLKLNFTIYKLIRTASKPNVYKLSSLLSFMDLLVQATRKYTMSDIAVA